MWRESIWIVWKGSDWIVWKGSDWIVTKGSVWIVWKGSDWIARKGTVWIVWKESDWIVWKGYDWIVWKGSFVSFDLILYVPSTIFELCRDQPSWVELAQGHNAVTPVRLEPAPPQSQVKHSTTEPLRSLERI